MLEVILLALAAVAIELIIQVGILAISAVLGWFLELTEKIDEMTLPFTIQERLASGEYTVYQGLFDQAKEEIAQVRKISAKKLDAKLQELHDKNDLVVYN